MFFTLVKPPRELAQVVDVDVDRLYFRRTLFYSFLIASFLFLVLAAIRFLTVEADESWILLSIGHLIGGPFAGMGVLSGPVVTSGGLYAVMHYPLMLAGTSVEIHRMVSFVFAGLTILAVYLIIRAQGARTWVALFGVVAFLTVPGLLLQAGMATAEMMATFLVIVGAWYWTDRGSLTLAGSVRSGLLFGLACATRTSAFIVVPAIIAWGALYHRSFRHLMTNTLIACGVACVVFILGTATLYALFRAGNEANFGDVATFFGKTTGLTAKRGLTSCMAYFFASNNLVPTLYNRRSRNCVGARPSGRLVRQGTSFMRVACPNRTDRLDGLDFARAVPACSVFVSGAPRPLACSDYSPSGMANGTRSRSTASSARSGGYCGLCGAVRDFAPRGLLRRHVGCCL